MLLKIKNLLINSTSKNSFFLKYIGDFTCELFGVQIKLNNILVLSGNYRVDKLDLLRKLFSFKDGDTRQCLFHAVPGVQTFFIRDIEIANQNMTCKFNGTPFSANWLGLKFDGFVEIKKKTKG